MTWTVTPYWKGKPGRVQRYDKPMAGKTPRQLAEDAANHMWGTRRKVDWIKVEEEPDKEEP